MRKMRVSAAAGLGSALVMAAGVQGVALAVPAGVVTTETVPPTVAQPADAAVAPASAVVQADEVQGSFAFTQTELSSNEWIAKHLGEGSRYLCGADMAGSGEEAAVEDWVLTIEGDVASPLSATVGELSESPAVQTLIMSCTCAGNPADGLAVANALVRGIPVLALVEAAQPDEAANTVVFTSADGYEMALPLSYLRSHYCPLVFDVNGSALAESVGGTNQLWLGSTPASYFVRDVTNIRVEARDEAPASPVSAEARTSYANLPNIGVMFGGDVS